MWYNRTMNYKNKSGTYTITNHTNGKIYYGSSQDIGVRWKEHRNALRRGDHKNGHLQNSWNKYGPAAFTFAVFDYCEVEDLYPYEQVLLDLHVGKEYCYNIGTDAKAPFRGRKHTEESKQKMKDSLKGRPAHNKGKPHTEETKRKIGDAQRGEKSHAYGKTKSVEARLASSKAQLGEKNHFHGKTHTDESRARMSETLRNKPKTECPHCGREFHKGNYSRWHGDKCKNKENK